MNRLFRTKLKAYDKEVLVSLVGRTSKQHVRQYLRAGIEALAGTQKHLSTKFWSEFFIEFGLSSALFSQIGEFVDGDEESEDVSTELLDVLLEARRDSPTQWRFDPFIDWLGFAVKAYQCASWSS